MRNILPKFWLFTAPLFIGGAMSLTASAQIPETSPPVPGSSASNVDPNQDPTNYSFNPLLTKRDPFTPPDSLRGKGTDDLTHYDLNEMNLVAILTGMGTPHAMIVLPNGKTHIVQIGDAIGRRNGKVFQIKSNELTVKESFKDYQNRTKSDLTSLVLAQ